MPEEYAGGKWRLSYLSFTGQSGNLEVDLNFIVKECRKGLSVVRPFTNAEREFLDLLLERGEIVATLLTGDKALRERIESQPLLEWKALNVRRHKGLS
jgi:hypothetical protein